MSARDPLPQISAHFGLDGIEFHRHVKVHVEAAVIDRFNGKREFAGECGSGYAGKARHAADGHACEIRL